MEKEVIVYGCNALDDDIRRESSSGGIFSLLARNIIEQGGIVFGTAMSEDCSKAEVISVEGIEGISKLRGSKYLQSNVGDSYKQIQKNLEGGRLVLFTGTPCQVNGLNLYLEKDYENLICMDIICHGVPSPALWKRYVNNFEIKYGCQVLSVNFRCKDESWRDFGIKQTTEEEVFFIPKAQDSYMQMFLKNYCLRPSCYNCTS